MKKKQPPDVLTAYLEDSFKVPTSENVKKRKRLSHHFTIIQQASTSSSIAECTYQSLLQDYADLKKKHESLQSQNKSLTERIRSLEKEKEEQHQKIIEMENSCRCPLSKQRLKQDFDRQKLAIIGWKGRHATLKKSVDMEKKRLKRALSKETEIIQLNSRLTSTRHYYNKIIKKYKETEVAKHRECRVREAALKEQIREIDLKLIEATGYGEKEDGNIVRTKDRGVYNTALRTAIYAALERQCPVDHAAEVVKIAVESCTGKTLSKLPCSSTVAQMAREMSTLSDLKTAEALVSSKNVTLAWDATELKVRLGD